ncbi:hypothetical protein B0T13DRAFT_83428 [Neurospora crassa]|nr:hypothetical protein B0T13DRAFT_83428 [Neurospora crassa]
MHSHVFGASKWKVDVLVVVLGWTDSNGDQFAATYHSVPYDHPLNPAAGPWTAGETISASLVCDTLPSSAVWCNRHAGHCGHRAIGNELCLGRHNGRETPRKTAKECGDSTGFETCSSRHKESTLPNIASLISHQRVGCHVKEWLQASASASELSPVSPRFGPPHLMLCLIRTRRLTLTRRLLLARDVYNQGLHGSITTRPSNFTIDTRSCSRNKSSPRAGLGVIRDIVYIRPAYIMRRSKQKQPITYLKYNYHHQSSSVLHQVETPTSLT